MLCLHLFSFFLFPPEFQNQPLIKQDSSSIEKRQCLYLAMDLSEVYPGVFFIAERVMGGDCVLRADRLVRAQAYLVW